MDALGERGGTLRVSSTEILDAMQDAVAVLDGKRRFVYANRAMAGLVGVPVERLLGKTCHDVVHGCDRPIEECPFARAVGSRERETLDLEIPGEGRWVRVTADPLRDAEGNFVGAVHILSDISAAKRLERRHAEESRLLRSLVDSVPGIVYRGLRDWSVTFIGAEVERLTGYSPQAFISGALTWKSIVHPADFGRVRALFREAVACRRTFVRVEYRIRHASGEARWIEDRRQLFYGADGRLASVDGLILDISDLKVAEDELNRTTEQLRTLVETSPLPIVALDLDGTVTLWNSAAERVFGWTAAEAVGRFNPIVGEGDREEFRGLIERVVRGGGFDGVEVRRRRKDGSPIDIRLFTAPMRDGSGAVTGVMAVIADITERKRIEQSLARSQEQLRQAQKMEAVGRLAGGVAHDFNNMLTAIRGYADLLLVQLQDNPALRREVEEIRKAGDRAAALTQQLLAFSRKQILQPKVVDLNHVVSGVDKMLRRLIGEDIDLVTVLRPDLGTVKVDPGQIEQVLMNLVVNARDAMPGGGKITIETMNVELSPEYASCHTAVRPGPHVLLAVTDNGVGMDEATRARLFEPFFTTKEKGKGTGLGLSTVYGIVKQSNGSIWVYSEPGLGTTFKIYFPQCDGECEAGRDADRRGTAPRGRETILLVEDEEMVRAFSREVLQSNGYTVLEAENGDDALRILASRENFIDLMITDVVMPRMGGRELAGRIPPRFAGMKIPFVSGYPDDAVGRHGIVEPGTPFLQKPFTVLGLLRKVREVLDA